MPHDRELDDETPALTAEVVQLDRELLPYSNGELWDEERVIRRILHHTEQIVLSAHHIGCDLIWTKKLMHHGQFEEWCQAKLPHFNERTLRRYMQVAEFLTAHPALLKPLASAGIKKTLLLTTLAPDQLEAVMSDGHLAETAIDELDTVPYWQLKQEVEKLKKNSGERDARLARTEKELERAKLVIAEASGALDTTDEAQLDVVDVARDDFMTAVQKFKAKLGPLLNRWQQGEVSPLVRGHVMAVLELADVSVKSVVYQAREAVGEGNYSAELMAIMEDPRPHASTYEIPEAIRPRAFTGGKTGGSR